MGRNLFSLLSFPRCMASPRGFGPVFFRRRSTLDWLSFRVFGQLANMGTVSAATRSSSRSSWSTESDVPRTVSSGNELLNIAGPLRQRRNSTLVLGQECSDSDSWDVPLRGDACAYSAVAGVAYLPFWRGTDPELPWGCRFVRRCGGYLDDKGPCAPVVLML